MEINLTSEPLYSGKVTEYKRDMNTPQEDWEQELDSMMIPHENVRNKPVVDWEHWHSKESYKRIKDFIRSVIESKQMEAYKFAREEIKTSYELYPTISAKELLKMVSITSDTEKEV